MRDPADVPSIKNLLSENAELRRRLDEAEETIRAIQYGAVDAFVVHDSKGNRVYTLESADRPYRLLVERMQQGAGTLDGEGRILYTNIRFAEIFGRTQPELIGVALADSIAPSDRALYQTLLLKGQEGASQGELCLRREDGSWIPAFVAFNSLPPETGAAIAVLITDLTIQKHQERVTAAYQALQNSEAQLQKERRALYEEREKLRVTLASIGDAVLTADTYGRVSFMNAVAEALTGWTLSEAEGQPLEAVFRIIDEQTREFLENPLHHAAAQRQTGAPGTHPVLIARDGRERPIDESSTPILDDNSNLAGVVLIFRDTTERRRVERDRRQSEERLRFVMNSMPQKIFTARSNGDLDYFNPIWFEFSGLSFDELKDWGWTRVIHPDDVAENIRCWKASVDTGEPFYFEHRFLRAGGGYRWHVSRAVALKDPDGKVLMWVGASTDIHEEKQAASQLRKLADTLSEADRRKNEFLALLAHELRNPLAPIRNAVEIIRRSDDNPASVRSASEMMERQIEQMVRLVDDLLDVSRITRGAIALRIQRIDLGTALRDAVEATRAQIDSKSQHLSVAVPSETLYLDADPARLMQIFGNLLNNASKFTPAGGRIQLDAERHNGDVIVRVRDNGIGIAADQFDRIFEMFTQVDTSLDRSVGGLGIGLTLVKNLVELHGGTVSVESVAGQGSVFVVRLPLVSDAPEALKPASEPPVRRIAVDEARRVLVVDDNRDSAESMAMLLDYSGYATRTANDGLEAIECASTWKPDVILLDIGLPKLNGYAVAAKIREASWGKNIILIALTGWGQPEDRRQSKEAGFNGHLVKPVELDTLTALLENLRQSSAKASDTTG